MNRSKAAGHTTGGRGAGWPGVGCPGVVKTLRMGEGSYMKSRDSRDRACRMCIV